MFNITISTSSDADLKALAQQIANIVEQATGQRCRVSVINRKPAVDYTKQMQMEAISKLQGQERPKLQ